ncbi:DUF7373 family lipoprotein [Mycobacterium heidelbergense]|uniref:DUF7373 family lipoprotein n=1 Tax=Mycobacterium heidelbergense TaxID=53376 RepID=UPI003CFA779C
MLRLARMAGAVAVIVVAGCSAPPKPPTSPAGGADVTSLDPGHYPTKPNSSLGNAGDAVKGGWVEARRMANNVVGPWEVDPALTEVHCCVSGVVKDPAALNTTLAAPLGDVVGKHNFLAGFASGKRSNLLGPHSIMDLTNVVLRFASAADAAAAVADMAAQSAALTPAYRSSRPTHPIAIPRYPRSTAVADTSEELESFVYAFTVHGAYVLCQQSGSGDGPHAAAQLVAATLDKQLPSIDQFTPTPAEQLPGLALDPTGLLAHTLQGDQVSSSTGVYEPRADMHIDSRLAEPAKQWALFNAVGLQSVAWAGTTVYETRDGSAAARLVEEFASAELAYNYRPAAGIKGMPNAKCLAPPPPDPQINSIPGVFCFAAAGRYTIVVFTDQQVDAHQRAAAQYLMLTAR